MINVLSAVTPNKLPLLVARLFFVGLSVVPAVLSWAAVRPREMAWVVSGVMLLFLLCVALRNRSDASLRRVKHPQRTIRWNIRETVYTVQLGTTSAATGGEFAPDANEPPLKNVPRWKLQRVVVDRWGRVRVQLTETEADADPSSGELGVGDSVRVRRAEGRLNWFDGQITRVKRRRLGNPLTRLLLCGAHRRLMNLIACTAPLIDLLTLSGIALVPNGSREAAHGTAALPPWLRRTFLGTLFQFGFEHAMLVSFVSAAVLVTVWFGCVAYVVVAQLVVQTRRLKRAFPFVRASFFAETAGILELFLSVIGRTLFLNIVGALYSVIGCAATRSTAQHAGCGAAGAEGEVHSLRYAGAALWLLQFFVMTAALTQLQFTEPRGDTCDVRYQGRFLSADTSIKFGIALLSRLLPASAPWVVLASALVLATLVVRWEPCERLPVINRCRFAAYMAAAWAALVGAAVQLQPSAAHRATLLVGTGWLVLLVGGVLAVVGGRCSSFGRIFRRQPPENSGSPLKRGGGPLDDPLLLSSVSRSSDDDFDVDLAAAAAAAAANSGSPLKGGGGTLSDPLLLSSVSGSSDDDYVDLAAAAILREYVELLVDSDNESE
jgi:hypothetical protein